MTGFKLRISAVLAVAGVLSTPAMAQSASSDLIQRIEESSGGMVTIDIPENVMRHIMRDDDRKASAEQPQIRPGINKMSGYRIQVFSDGSNQRTLEARAKSRGNAIVAKFPKYRGQVYSFSSAPNWYTRIGNFRSQAEASAALAELKRAFPSLSAEMRVVKSQIVIIGR